MGSPVFEELEEPTRPVIIHKYAHEVDHHIPPKRCQAEFIEVDVGGPGPSKHDIILMAVYHHMYGDGVTDPHR